MTVRLLHVADLHLGRAFPYLGETAPSRRQDLVDTFARVCALAHEEEVAALLIAGDLFDSVTPPASLLEMVESELAGLGKAGVRVFVVPGDNDTVWYERSVWRHMSLPSLHVFQQAVFDRPQRFEVDGQHIAIHGCAYNPLICPDPLDTLQPIMTGINVALLHGTVDPPAGVPLEPDELSLSRLDLFHSGMDYVALGHVHRRTSYEYSGRIVAAYPGTPEGLEMTETGRRFAGLITFSGEAQSVRFVPVNGREIRSERLNASGASEDDIAAALAEMASESVLLSARLVGSPQDVLDVPALLDRLRQSFFWLDIQDHTRVSRSEAAERMSAEATIGGRFVRAVRRRIDTTGDAQERDLLELAMKLGLSAMRERPSA